MRLGNTGLSKRERELERGSLGDSDTDETVQTVAEILEAGANLLPSIFGGGGGCSASDRQMQQQLAQKIDQYLTTSDKRNLVQIAHSSISPTGADMARFEIGGHDCKHKNVHPDDARFRNELKSLLQQRMQAQQGPPSGMTMSVGGIPNAVKYALIGLGIAGAVTAGNYGFQKLK
jgi:hypothetical protein